MAILFTRSYEHMRPLSCCSSVIEGRRQQEAEMRKLQAWSDEIDPDAMRVDIRGAVLRFPIQNDYAYYYVRGEIGRGGGRKGVSIQHLPYGEGLEVSSEFLRRLTREDILNQLRERQGFLRRSRASKESRRG